MGIFTNIGQNLSRITNGQSSAASLFNGGNNPTAPSGPVPNSGVGNLIKGALGFAPTATPKSTPSLVAPGTYGNQTSAALTPNGIQNAGSNLAINAPTNNPYDPSGIAMGPKPIQGTTNPTNTSGAVQTAAQNIQGANLDNTPTYALGDGSTYSSSGLPVSAATNPGGTAQGYSYAPGSAVQSSGPVGFNAQVPNISQPSTALSGNTGSGDIQSLITKNLNNMDSLFSNLSKYSTVGSAEQQQQGKVANDQAAMTGLGYQEQGLYNPNNQNIALPFLTGQAQNKLVGAGIQSTLDQSVLNYMQGNRQFAFNSASTIFDASRNNLETSLDAYAKAAPQNLSTNYNPNTGEVNTIMRNPLTGATYTSSLGNIGPQQAYTSTTITTDPQTGALTFVGTKSDGTIVQLPVSGNGTGGATIQNPTLQGSNGSGNYTQTGSPQVQTAGALLSNWTSGGKTTPGQGYQGAVYQTFSKLTGQQIDANTPTSTLVSNIPALTQGIIKAENIGQGLVGATNNPTGILYANQPGATPYKAQNGYTYAKFPTYQDGVNAAQDLVAKKLGASPSTPEVSPGLQQTVQNLPPALQGSVHYLPDGTPFFNANQLTAAQIPMAQSAASRTGIPYINGDNASKLDTISVAQQNLQSLSDYAKQTLHGGGVFGKIGNMIQGSGANTFFGSTVQTNFNTYRNLAISSLQGLVGGSGSGLRITAGEIATQIDNLPSSSDTPGQAATKAAALSAQLNKWTSQIIPGWKPSDSSAPATDYTATLNNLIKQYSPQ